MLIMSSVVGKTRGSERGEREDPGDGVGVGEGRGGEAAEDRSVLELLRW